MAIHHRNFRRDTMTISPKDFGQIW